MSSRPISSNTWSHSCGSLGSWRSRAIAALSACRMVVTGNSSTSGASSRGIAPQDEESRPQWTP